MSYTIEDYMLNDLNLSGNELLTFAFLSTQGVYKDTLEHMRKMVGMKSVNTLRSTLKSLGDKGLITITKEEVNSPTTYSVVNFDTQENKCHNIEKINPKDLFRHGAKTRRILLD